MFKNICKKYSNIIRFTFMKSISCRYEKVIHSFQLYMKIDYEFYKKNLSRNNKW